MVVVAATAAFVLIRTAPGDALTDEGSVGRMPVAVRATRRVQLGLDLPPAQQYVRRLGAYSRGDFGWSTSEGRTVNEVLRERVPRTLLLMSLALAASLLLGIALGAWQGAHVGSRTDRAWSFASLVLFSFPEFWIAIVLMLVFASWLGWFPTMGMTSDIVFEASTVRQLLDHAHHIVLPWLSLTLVGTAIVARFQRAAMRDVFDTPFVRTARGKGLTEAAVRRHALRAALLPVIALGGMLVPSLFAGAVFVESIFAWQGMGLALLKATRGRDYDLVGAGILVVSAMTVAGSFAAELLREMADPRIRRG